MLCPTDSYNRYPFNGSDGSNSKKLALGDNWARGNYAANGDLDYMSASGTDQYAGGPTRNWAGKTRRPAASWGVNCSVRTADVMGDGHEQHHSVGRSPGGNHRL